jgi:hypothetical protein
MSIDELQSDLERAQYLVNLLVSAATGKERDERGYKARTGPGQCFVTT